MLKRLLFSLLGFLVLSGFSSCNFHEAGTLEVDLFWETSNYVFGTCYHANVDLMRYTITDHRGDIVATSHGVVPCKNYLSTYLSPGGEFTLDVEGYRYDRYDKTGRYDEYMLEWSALCSSMEVDGRDTYIYVCEVIRDGGEY